MTIKIAVSDKRAAVDGTPVIVCGNSGYSIEFTFDEEWNAYTKKTARFRWLQNSAEKHKDVEFTGTTVAVPKLFDTCYVKVGVYAGDLCTTTPAKVLCKRSILCGKSEEQISPQEKARLQAQINDLGDRVGALEKGGTGGNTGNDSGQNGNQGTGLSTAAKNLLISILRNGIYRDDFDAASTITALETELVVSAGGSGSESGDGTTYTVTNVLTNVTNKNTAGTVSSGSSYFAVLTPDDGLEISSVMVTMNGADITHTAYADGVVNIIAVTGNVVITAIAEEKLVDITQNADGALTIVAAKSVTQNTDGTLLIA